MRDRGKYAEHGRNDPLSDQQRQEHPYDFVSLPDKAVGGQAAGHDRFHPERLTGRLYLVYEIVTPLHVGSGVLESAAECGLAGEEMPVRGILRRQGLPVLPGSSWKGAVRARFEAITRSRLGVEHRPSRIEHWKLPRPLQPGGGHSKVEILVSDPRVRTLKPVRKRRGESLRLEELSPAEALFGAMGYRGRLHPGEGRIEGPAAREPLAVPPLESPAAHRLAVPGKSEVVGTRVVIHRVEGRKFYYDGPLLDSRKNDAGQAIREWIDAVPAGCRIHIEVIVESVTPSEMGALLLSAGYGEGVGIVRFGGFKPAGLGKVRLLEIAGQWRKGWKTGSWSRPPVEPFDPDDLVSSARRDRLIDDAALAELHEITTRLRP